MSKDEQLIKALLHPSKKEQAFNTTIDEKINDNILPGKPRNERTGQKI